MRILGVFILFTATLVAIARADAKASATPRQLDTKGRKYKANCPDPFYVNSCQLHKDLQCDAPDLTSGMAPVSKEVRCYMLAVQPSTNGGGHPTLHGLWPQNSLADGTKESPRNCPTMIDGAPNDFSRSVFNDASTLLVDYWRSRSQEGNDQECFIMHQWWKHGTCAVDRDGNPMTQKQFYLTAVGVLRVFNAQFPESYNGFQQNGESLQVIRKECVDCVFDVIKFGLDFDTFQDSLDAGAMCTSECAPNADDPCSV